MRVRAAGTADSDAVYGILTNVGARTIVVHGTTYDAATLPALVAEHDGRIIGVLTYNLVDGELEVVSLHAVDQRRGAGTALLDAAAAVARQAGARRLWLITTNDNLDALRFYQRRGMRLVAVAPGAVDAAREIKRSIPRTGDYGIPLHDELELELLIS
ncbi:GNAT family N-acetyltransferase [Kribbella jejuensis]|uniref:N-acetylglutamate synthase-like GNAT family acetyltransferase n=1 Tax=Kribbella jejuensis TaxID=236068 RepID=A0A542EW06_9ACTN|nr:GNAT family N-acetyltransferase [Kribbella jejuensis]TQJ19394.1 N-acetylglutamate synthase-like GNAT family acetyltransferase [Kribbella jejuensis]